MGRRTVASGKPVVSPIAQRIVLLNCEVR